jgi:hypothetical protein
MLKEKELLDILLTVHQGTLMNQHQLDTILFVYQKSMPLHVSGVTRSSSGGSAQMMFGAITCVGCVLTACNYVRSMCVDCVQLRA